MGSISASRASVQRGAGPIAAGLEEAAAGVVVDQPVALDVVDEDLDRFVLADLAYLSVAGAAVGDAGQDARLDQLVCKQGRVIFRGAKPGLDDLGDSAVG